VNLAPGVGVAGVQWNVVAGTVTAWSWRVSSGWWKSVVVGAELVDNFDVEACRQASQWQRSYHDSGVSDCCSMSVSLSVCQSLGMWRCVGMTAVVARLASSFITVWLTRYNNTVCVYADEFW